MSVTISYPSTQYEELYGPFVNLRAYLPPKHNSPNNINVDWKKRKGNENRVLEIEKERENTKK